MSETKMSDYIKGFNAGVDCVLTEIKHLDPQRDQKTAQTTDKGAL